MNSIPCPVTDRSKPPTVARDNGSAWPLPAYRIVVVDDDRSLAELLARLLRAIGQSVTVAFDGEMVRRTLREERSDVVIVDLAMARVDAIELGRQLRGQSEMDSLVLIALFGNSTPNGQRRPEAAVFDQYLIKPTGIAKLAEVLEGICTATRTCQS